MTNKTHCGWVGSAYKLLRRGGIVALRWIYVNGLAKDIASDP
jgi:hypothetical protein